MTETLTPAIGTKLPLLFNYRDTLFGNGVVLDVQVTNGRALGVPEDGGFWIYGVNPGAMSAVGEDLTAAHVEFRQMFSDILKDFALEATTVEEFRTLVGRFFDDTNRGYEADWTEAVDVVRQRDIEVVGLPKVSADSPRHVSVEMKRINQIQPADNKANIQLDLAA